MLIYDNRPVADMANKKLTCIAPYSRWVLFFVRVRKKRNWCFRGLEVILTGIRNALTEKYKTWERKQTDAKISRI